MTTPEEPLPAAAQGHEATAPDDGAGVTAAAAPVRGGSSSVADGEWHRMHPMTPLLKGGIVLLILFGILISNMRDRVVGWFVERVTPEGEDFHVDYEGDPIQWLISNDLILAASLVALGLVVLLCVVFYISWRFRTFRITEEHVEVRKGILFRSHRRAPLDRVQGVNLTRPFLARMIGLAKLEVVGAGTDANVALEYLNTSLAEEVRADILRLASGARVARRIARGDTAPEGAAARFATAVVEGITGVVEGVDTADVVSESLVRIPAGRIVGSQLLMMVPWFVLAILMTAGIVMLPLIFASEEERLFAAFATVLGVGLPLLITFVAILWSLISRSLRYSISATGDGVRMTYGLLTTVTETLPPGRVHALEITQPLLWRGFGWWAVRINRMTGSSATAQASSNQQQFTTALPVGLVQDVVRVVNLMLPELPARDLPLVYEHGIDGPVEGDPYRTMRKGVGWRRPLSWRRHGYVLTDYALLLRRGRIWRKVAVFPLARLQSISISQGPIDRAQDVGSARAHTIVGPVSGVVTGVDREPLQELLDDASRRATLAASRDTSHRWAEVLEEVMAAQAAAAVSSDPSTGSTTGQASDRTAREA